MVKKWRISKKKSHSGDDTGFLLARTVQNPRTVSVDILIGHRPDT